MANKIHMGTIVRGQFSKRGCTVAWFARQLACDRSNIYDIFRRESIDTKMLWKISCVLEFNFFELLADKFTKEQNKKSKSV